MAAEEGVRSAGGDVCGLLLAASGARSSVVEIFPSDVDTKRKPRSESGSIRSTALGFGSGNRVATHRNVDDATHVRYTH